MELHIKIILTLEGEFLIAKVYNSRERKREKR